MRKLKKRSIQVCMQGGLKWEQTFCLYGINVGEAGTRANRVLQGWHRRLELAWATKTPQFLARFLKHVIA